MSAAKEVGASIGPRATAALARFGARVRWGLLLGGFADGVAALGLVGAATLVILRLFGVVAAPSPWWAAAAVVPAAAAVVRWRRRAPAFAQAAAHMDRRLGMGGLLLTGLEVDASAWRGRVEEGIEEAAKSLPRPRWGRALAHAGLPAALLVGACVLPPLSTADDRTADPALARALDRLERRVEEAAKRGGLREEAKKEIAEKVEGLKDRRATGEAVSWADLDAAEERMDREVKQRVADLAKAKALASAFAREEHGDAAAAQREMATLLAECDKAGVRDAVSQALAAKAGASASGRIDPRSLSADAATLDALAKAMGEAAGDRLDSLSEMGLADAADAEALDRLMEGDPTAALSEEGEECEECHGERPDECGT